jgi:hypothetical protein
LLHGWQDFHRHYLKHHVEKDLRRELRFSREKDLNQLVTLSAVMGIAERSRVEEKGYSAGR